VLAGPIRGDFDFLSEPCWPEVVQRRLQEEWKLEVVVRLPLFEEFRITPAIAGPLRFHRRLLAETLSRKHPRELDFIGKPPACGSGVDSGILRVEREFPFARQIDGLREYGTVASEKSYEKRGFHGLRQHGIPCEGD